MKKFLVLIALTSMMLAGCTNEKENDPTKDSNYGKEGDITVKFYLDYNQLAVDEVYEQYLINNHSKLKAPTTPTAEQAPLPEFPAFKGWSTKQIVDDDADLWNFSTDTVDVDDTVVEFRLYGFWASQGE